MKKNVMMRVASALLVAVLMTTCAISGTFAKYTTTVNNVDTARVAAWGFGTSTTIDFELFSTEYGATVVSKDGTTNVIAPGTSQAEMIKLNYANTAGLGAPEVAYTIDINVLESDIGANIKANTSIVWSFNGVEYAHDGVNTSWDKLIAALEAYHEEVGANNLPAIANTGIEISWNWAFDGNDTADTALGDATTLETVTLKIEIVATQVD